VPLQKEKKQQQQQHGLFDIQPHTVPSNPVAITELVQALDEETLLKCHAGRKALGKHDHSMMNASRHADTYTLVLMVRLSMYATKA
jgi:hypothetical protein